ncbi:MAG TPA: hypothetical protein VGK41_01340 [Solirubrobacterales bacterium]
MKRSTPGNSLSRIRRIFGRGMLEGVRAAGIPNPEEFLMSQKNLRGAVAGLNSTATKVLAAVPLAEEWTISQICAELGRVGQSYSRDVVEGSLGKLLEIGAVRVHGLGPGRTFRSLYSVAIDPEPEDLQKAVRDMTGPVPGAKPQGIEPLRLSKTLPVDDPLGFLATLASDARVLARNLQILADRIDEGALMVTAKIEEAGAADAELKRLRAVFRELAKEE